MTQTNEIRVMTGTKVITKNGIVEAQDIKVGSLVLTDSMRFETVKRVKQSNESEFYLIHIYGLDPFSVDCEALVNVRDLQVSEVGPLVSWPYWIPVKDIEEDKHLIHSPSNPHHGLTSEDMPSGYFDENKYWWLQVKEVELQEKAMDCYRFTIESDCGITIERIAIK